MEPLVNHPIRILALVLLLLPTFGCQSATTVPVSSPTPAPLPTQIIIPSPVPPTPTNEPGPTLTSEPGPTPTSEPGPTPPVAADILQLSPASYAVTGGDEAQAAIVYAVKILDYLHTHTNAPERPALLERLANTLGYRKGGISFDWLILEWLNETILPSFEATGGPPAGWEALPTDLDNDGQPDYVMSFYFQPPGSQMNGDSGLYWIAPANGRFVARNIAVLLDTPPLQKIEVLGSQDFDGDGGNDLAYTTAYQEEIEISTIPHLVTRRNGEWQEIPILPEGIVSSHLGAWSVALAPDDIPELILTESYRTSPLVEEGIFDYQVHFRYMQGTFIPASLLPVDPNEQAPEWAELLILNRRYAEALAVVQSGIQDTNRLYHAGLAYLFTGDLAGAQIAWENLLKMDPGNTVQQLLPLLQGPNSLWRVCAWLNVNAPTPNPEVLCGKDTLIAWQSWTQAESIEDQAGRLGLNWQRLSGEYDLNGDGSPDPLGLVDQTPWVFLSTPGGYTPFLATQSLPPGTGVVHVRWVNHWPGEYSLQILVSDLDANQRPEIVVVRPEGFTLYQWLGQRFAPHKVTYQDAGGQTVTGQLTLVQPVPGDIAALEVILENDPLDNRRHYELVDGEIVETTALPAQLPPAFPCPSCAIEALFDEQDPQRTLEMLPGEPPGDRWEAAQDLYLQGLAAEYSDDRGAASLCYETIIGQYADTAWAQLAQEKLALP